MQCEQIGTACVILGGGRERKEDSVDPAVGIVLHKKVGDRVAAGEPIATIYYNAEAKAARARQLIEASCVVADAAPSTKRPLIHHESSEKSRGEKLNGTIHGNSWSVDHARARLHFLHQSARHSR